MATVQTISEGVFLISWDINGTNGIPHQTQSFTQRRNGLRLSPYDQPHQSIVNINKISLSCRLSIKISNSGTSGFGPDEVLEVDIYPISTTKEKDKNVQILKPASILAIKNGVSQLMKLRNSTWTTTFSPLCACGERVSQYVFEILIDFDLKTDSKLVLDHLFNLWETKTLADVTFKFKEKDVQAHTLIIASGSPVLAAMFQNDFKEKQERVVVIKDIKSAVFEKMLCFFYTGNANLDIADVADLLIAADKYVVDSLKKRCALYMAGNLTVENVIRYLVVSHLHESPNLYKAALEFISKNSEAIVSRKDWVDLMKNYHELSLAAVQMMVLAKNKSSGVHSRNFLTLSKIFQFK